MAYPKVLPAPGLEQMPRSWRRACSLELVSNVDALVTRRGLVVGNLSLAIRVNRRIYLYRQAHGPLRARAQPRPRIAEAFVLSHEATRSSRFDGVFIWSNAAFIPTTWSTFMLKEFVFHNQKGSVLGFKVRPGSLH